LRRSIDGLVEEAPDNWEAALNRGFHLSNRRVNGSIGPTKERRDLVDTEQCVRIERESEKHLTAGEVLLVERCAVGENRLKIAATAPNSVEFFPGYDTLLTAARTGRIPPKFLESPLDAASSGFVLTSTTPSSINCRNIPPNAG